MLKRIRTLFRKADDADSGEPTDGAPAVEDVARPPVHRGPAVVHHPIDEVDLDPDAVKIVQRLARFDHTAYLVGGCVRDLLLDRKPKDFDIATSATPRQVKRAFRNCRIIGRRFRLAHIYFHGGKIIEVATFRALEEPVDDDADGDADLMIRDDNVFGSPEEDALRRDFTVNALFYDIAEGNVIDHADGLADLRRRVVRTIGDPEVRFREDPIRILRAIKFAARLDFEIESNTLAGLEKVRDEIPRAATPRIIEELHRFYREGSARRAFNLLLDTGVLRVVLPELTDELTSSPARRELTGALLADADRRRAAGETLRMGTLFAALLLPELAPAFGWSEDGRVDPPKRMNPRQLVDRRLRPVAERLRVPRREQEHCRQTLMSLARMVPADRVRKPTLRSILARESREDSVALLAVLAEQRGGPFAEALDWWREAIEEQGDSIDPADRREAGRDEDDGPDDGERPRRRRSRGGRRRGRRGGKRASTTDDERPDDPKPARSSEGGRSSGPARSNDGGRSSGSSRSEGTRSGDAKRTDPSMPPPWDDRYFFAALPTVPERVEPPEPGEAEEPAEPTVASNASEPDADTAPAGRPRKRRGRRGGRRRGRGGERRTDDASGGDDS